MSCKKCKELEAELTYTKRRLLEEQAEKRVLNEALSRLKYQLEEKNRDIRGLQTRILDNECPGWEIG